MFEAKNYKLSHTLKKNLKLRKIVNYQRSAKWVGIKKKSHMMMNDMINEMNPTYVQEDIYTPGFMDWQMDSQLKLIQKALTYSSNYKWEFTLRTRKMPKNEL